jgi:hypothetical protein
MGDVIELFVADVFEAFPGGGEFFVNFDGLFRHDFMGFLRTAHEDEVGAGGDALVTIGIQTKANHQGFAAGLFRFFGVSHIRQVRTEAGLRQYVWPILWSESLTVNCCVASNSLGIPGLSRYD